MKKTLFTISYLLLSISCLGQSLAKFGFSGEIAFPYSLLGKEANIGYGGSARFSFIISNKITSTLNIGFIQFNGNEQHTIENSIYTNNSSIIPISAGVNFFLYDKLYLLATAGASIIRVSTEFSDIRTNLITTKTKFYSSLGIGYHLDLNSDFSLFSELLYNLVENSNYASLRIGFNYTLE